MQTDEARRPGFLSGRGGLLIALACSLLLLAISRHFTWSIPQLNWDEGTRMSIASALNHGGTLYVDAWDHHTFLDILFFQGLFKVLPAEQVPLAVRVVNALIVLGVCLLAFLAVRRMSGDGAWALGTALICGFLFSRDWALSSTGEFYHTLPVCLAFGLYFAWGNATGMTRDPLAVAPDDAPPAGSASSRPRVRLLLVGALFAIGFFIKQTAVYDLLALAILATLQARSRGNSRIEWRALGIRLGRVVLGGCGVAACSVAYFAAKGALGQAMYMTFIDPLVYATGTEVSGTLQKYRDAVVTELGFAARVSWPLTAALAVSCVLLFLPARDGTSRRLAAGAAVWLIVDMAGLVLIGRFYDHYLVQLIVPAAVLGSYWLSRLGGTLRTVGVALVLLAFWFWPIWEVLARTGQRGSGIDWANVRRVSAWVKDHTSPGEGLYLYQNPALCLYFLTERFPPTKVFMDHQLLPENKDGPGLLKEAMSALERTPPRVIVVGDLGRSVPEIEAFIQMRYRPVTNIGIHQVFMPVTPGP
jgi:hypothetical protein